MIKSKKRLDNNRNLTDEEEKEFLDRFGKETEAGKLAVINDIIKSYEKFIGKPVAKSLVYRMLKRHNWRKIIPINKHQKKRALKKSRLIKKSQIR